MSDGEMMLRGARAHPARLAEFLALFVGVPVAVAVLLPPGRMFSVLFAVTGLGIVLLARTPGFSWRELLRGGIDWRATAAFTGATVVTATAVILLTEPRAFLFLPRENPGLMLAIVALYPIFSALPQELLFRPLFFRRYGALLPGPRTAVLLNAALFSLAHLMYWSGIVAAMTFCGGLAFAWAYEIRRSFPMALLLHMIAGWIVFAVGLGEFFYTGNIERPW